MAAAYPDVVVLNETGTIRRKSGSTGDAPGLKKSRPLMMMILCVVMGANKASVTKAKALKILLKEFDIDLTTSHELASNIYVYLVQMVFKDWPDWNVVNQRINFLKRKKDCKSIQTFLEITYIDLKYYIKVVLDTMAPEIQKAVSKLIELNASMKANGIRNMVLKIKNLNEVIISQPDRNINNSLNSHPSSACLLNKVPSASILNWWDFRITIDCKYIRLTRYTGHRLKHALVNGNRGARDLKQELFTGLQYRKVDKTTLVDTQNVIILLRKLLIFSETSVESSLYTFFNQIMHSLIEDFKSARELPIPCLYRRYMNKYPYYRKLRKQGPPAPATIKGDFNMEVLAPMHYVDLHRMLLEPWTLKGMGTEEWLTAECMKCKVKFGMQNIVYNLKVHYDMYHGDEPMWTCTNCQQSFSMNDLAIVDWRHYC